MAITSSTIREWLLTGVLVVGLLGGALWWRNHKQTVPAPGSLVTEPNLSENRGTNTEPLPRTRALILQKLGSLESYNQKIPEETYLSEFSHWTAGAIQSDGQRRPRTVGKDAFEEITRYMVDQVIPQLWSKAQQLVGDKNLVTHGAMAKIVHQQWPQQLLPNGHVVVFPGHPQLRRVVSEVRQDYLRDTGWHWRWIGRAIEEQTLGDPDELGELDIYAAEELSEFLSVLAVGLIEWSDRLPGSASKSPGLIDAAVMQRTLVLMQTQARDDAAHRERRTALYSELARERVMGGLPKPMFANVTKRLGINFQHAPDPELDQRRAELVVPTGIAGGGVSAADFDGDGFTDLYYAGGGGGQLWRNVEGKGFENVTTTSGLTTAGETRAGYFVDYDNDGDLDLYQTLVLRPNRLYRNEGNAKFSDVTEASGVGGGKLVTHGAVWFDFDRDGLLDLYVANFGMWPNGDSPDLTIRNSSAPANQFFHQRIRDGKHVFEEVAGELGVADRGWTHCVGAWDFDQDGWPDLVSLNDFGQTIAYRNDGGKRFLEETRTLHLDVVHNAMNFQLVDLEHNGHPAMYVTEISKLTHRVRYPKPVQGTQIKFAHLDNLRALVVNKLLRRLPSGAFEDVHDIHIEPAQLGWAWDASVFDYENDGDLDLLVLNGTEGKDFGAPAPSERHRQGREFITQYAGQTNVCFLSDSGYFYDVSKHCELAYAGNSRGSAWFDFDNDGDLDVAVSDYNGAGRVFENQQAAGHHWIRLQLEGAGGNRNAVGARVAVRFGDDQQRFDQVVCGKGFLSQNPYPLHFGLGAHDKVMEVLIIWPDGRKQTLNQLAVDQVHRLQQPAP